MKNHLFLFLFLILATYATGQELSKKPSSDDVRAYNRSNLLKIENGMSKTEVINAMGGIQTIQTYTSRGWAGSKVNKISNPYSRDLKSDKDGNSIEILWYYTDVKERDDAINKDELTPIILEEGKVVGLGWGFYEDYAKRKEFTIDIK
jgi:hypothetical protein